MKKGHIYSKNDLINELTDLKEEHGKVVADTVRNHSEISLTPFKEQFGSWNEAKKEADLEQFKLHPKPEFGIRGHEYLQWIVENYSCQRCGLDENACIEFHHIEKREHYIGKLRHKSQRHSSTTALKELKKTVPLCANCHKRNHSDSNDFVATKEMIPNYTHPKDIDEVLP